MNRNEPGAFFKNQPSYLHFNKPFDDYGDALFLHINEINPIFMKPEHIQDSFECRVLLDPRTKKEVKQTFYDHTDYKKHKAEIFRSLTQSRINIDDQLKCLRLLKSWQELIAVNYDDVLRWRSLQLARREEKKVFDEFVRKYSSTQKVAIYAPTERLVKLYKNFYAVKLQHLLTQFPDNLALNTQAGLPIPLSNQAAWARSIQIEDVCLLQRRGWLSVAKDYAQDLERLDARLESCMDYFIKNINEEENSKLNINLEGELKSNQICIPLESLLFLLTAGSSPDLPTEVPLEIEDDCKSEFKVIKFRDPLPSRNCGWYTHNFVVENAFGALMSTSQNTQWLYVENKDLKFQKTFETPIIEAFRSQTPEYRLTDFDEYIKGHSTKHVKSMKTNKAIIEWNLNSHDYDKKHLKFLTELNIPPAKGKYGAEILQSCTFKLEYKPEFGAEIMTKYELLKEWFQLKLWGQCDGFADHGLCLRVAVSDFSLQLEHSMLIDSVEHQLNDLYQIKMPQLLAGLADTLHLLINMPKGKYFLRFNCKYPDKFLLSAPSKEITPNTVFLHNLLKVEPSDLLFMTHAPHLPISDLLCTIVHKKYQVIPCAFKPCFTNQYKNGKKRKTYRRTKSDEEYIRKRLNIKLAEKLKLEKDRKRRRRIQKRKIRAQKGLHRKRQKKDENAKDQEIERLMNEC